MLEGCSPHWHAAERGVGYLDVYPNGSYAQPRDPARKSLLEPTTWVLDDILDNRKFYIRRASPSGSDMLGERCRRPLDDIRCP